MSEQYCANHHTLCLSAWNMAACGYWCLSACVQETNTSPAKSFGGLPVGMADLLFDPLAIVCVNCCVYIRTQEMHWSKCYFPCQCPPGQQSTEIHMD